PLGPSTATNSCSSTAKLTSAMAARPLKDLLKPSITRRGAGGEMRDTLHQPPPQPAGELVERGDDDENDGNDGEEPREVEQIHAVLELLPDTARPDDAQHGGCSHVELPPEERRREHHRQEVGNERVADRREAARTGRAYRLEGPEIGVLDRVGEEFGGASPGVKGDAEHAGKGTESDGGHEEQCEDEAVDAAERVQEPARGVIEPREG